jgi:hypothetical protein
MLTLALLALGFLGGWWVGRMFKAADELFDALGEEQAEHDEAWGETNRP